MEIESYIIGFVVGVSVGRLSMGSNVDKKMQHEMLDYLQTHQSFTVNSFIEKFNYDKGFFKRSKVRNTASHLVTSGQIDCETLSTSNFFNRDGTVLFTRKKV